MPLDDSAIAMRRLISSFAELLPILDKSFELIAQRLDIEALLVLGKPLTNHRVEWDHRRQISRVFRLSTRRR